MSIREAIDLLSIADPQAALAAEVELEDLQDKIYDLTEERDDYLKERDELEEKLDALIDKVSEAYNSI